MSLGLIKKLDETLYIIISTTTWDSPFWASRHYVSRALATIPGCRVVFVERMPALLSSTKREMSVRDVMRWNRLVHINETLSVYHPFPRLPFAGRIKRMADISQRLLCWQILRLMKQFKADQTVIISFDHRAGVIFRKFRDKCKTVYYVVDEIKEFLWAARLKAITIREESETIKQANMVIASSQPLLEKAIAMNPRCRLIIHGVDVDAYRDAPPPNDFSDINAIKPPIVGFMGKIEHWVDTEMIHRLAQLMPDVSFVLIGSRDVNIDSLISLPNIHYLGVKARNVLPSYLKQFSIALIPFKSTELTRNVNPLKLYEYLAAGLPVISTPMDAARNLEELDVFVEKDFKGFHDRIRYLLKNIDRLNRNKKHLFVQKISWEHKARELHEYCSSIKK